MKYLVLGAYGMAGHFVSIYLSEAGHNVSCLDKRKNTLYNSIIGDIRDSELIKKIVTEGKFDAVINCIGILNQAAEKNMENAVYLNSYFPHLLVDLTTNINTQIVHLSTDCVFSGKRGRYSESDLRDGETFYDRTKSLGEINDNKNLTIRTSIIGPDLNENGIGLFNWFMLQRGKIRGYTGVMWTGITTLELAKVIESATKTKANGLYNMVYKEPISKYNLLVLLNKHFKNNDIEIEPFGAFISDKSLLRTRFEFDYIVPDYEKMISDLSIWIKSHQPFYPHYNF